MKWENIMTMWKSSGIIEVVKGICRCDESDLSDIILRQSEGKAKSNQQDYFTAFIEKCFD